MPENKKLTKETRDFLCEVRAEQDEEHGTFITGRPIVFNSVTDLGWIREVIDPEAIDIETDLRDVRLLVGHNTSMIPLARSRRNTPNSSMELKVDEQGLFMRANLDTENNTTANELYSAVGRGDISGMSFMFTVDEDSWEDLDTEKPLRHIRHIDRIFEVSAVAFPAYEETSLEAADVSKTLESVKASLESAKRQLEETREKAARNKALLKLRLKIAKLKKED